VQFELGQGPDIDVVADRFSVLISDTEVESRWPNWAATVAAARVRSVLGTRLHPSASTTGSLTLYDVEPNHFSVADHEVAHIAAHLAAVALASVQDTANLWRAIDARKDHRPGAGHPHGTLLDRRRTAFAVRG
jgi:GAF domain-containing protein